MSVSPDPDEDAEDDEEEEDEDDDDDEQTVVCEVEHCWLGTLVHCCSDTMLHWDTVTTYIRENQELY